ncbi:MAG: hypothetical protein ACPGEF_01360 [Endozoicomonas sp.]
MILSIKITARIMSVSNYSARILGGLLFKITHRGNNVKTNEVSGKVFNTGKSISIGFQVATLLTAITHPGHLVFLRSRHSRA